MALYSSKENQDFYINGIKISGLQSLSIKWNSQVEPSLRVGYTDANYINSKFIEADLNIEYIPLNNDIFLSFTGNTMFSGKFNYNDKYFIFNTGLLNNYSLNYQLDSLINARADLKVFAEVFSATGTENLKSQNFSIDPYDYEYAEIYLDSQVIDKTLINSFGLTIDCQKSPSYKIGRYIPDEFIPELPLKINFNMNAEINNYNFSGITNIYTKPKLDNLNIKLNKYSNQLNTHNLNFNNLTKMDETSSFSTINNGQINMSYNGLF
jgi:hypothetical protein